MNSIRKAFRGGLIACAVATGLVVIASAPAASAPGASRPLLTGAAARGQPLRAIEILPASTRKLGSARLSSRLVASRQDLSTTPAGFARVIVETDSPARARASVQAVGGRVERVAGNLLQVLVRPGKVDALSRRPGVALVRAPSVLVEHAVAGEEVSTALAGAWHEKGFTGKGVKVAIIDGGFAGLAERQAAGELPANVVTQDYCGGEFSTVTEHGTAVAEIVHEMAPDAQLYLVCVGTEVDMVVAVGYAKTQGVQVINHSAGWEGPFREDGSSMFGAMVADAKAAGILWVNSAGNEAQTHWSGTYQDAGGVHAWAADGDQGNSFVWPNGWGICGFLKWDEWPNGVSDFDLALVLSGSNVLLAMSDEYQTGTQPPFEGLCVRQTSGSDLVVYWAIVGYRVTTSPRLDLTSWSLPLQYQVAAGSIAEPATSPAALAVGALCWQSRQLESYSSQGPTIDGRVKPDLAGHDAVSSTTYGAFDACPGANGLSGFAGTSASSPEVAGAAALVRQAYPRFTPDQVKQYLMQAARDLGTAGPDNLYGAGELQLPAPPDLVAPSARALPSSGHRGKVVKLRSTVSDDSGQVSVVEQVKRGGRTIATIKRPGYVAAGRPRTVSVAWKAPANAKGAYQHCVRALDRAGNSSAPSCAQMVLR